MSDAERLLNEARRLGEETYQDVRKRVMNLGQRWWWAIAAGCLGVGFVVGLLM